MTTVQPFSSTKLPALRSDVFRSPDGAELPFSAVVKTLVSARGSDPLVHFITRGARDRARAQEGLFRLMTNDALACRGLLASAEGDGVALVLQPNVRLKPPAKSTTTRIAGASGWPRVAASLRPLIEARPSDAAFLTAVGVHEGSGTLEAELVAAARQLAPARAMCAEVSHEADVAAFASYGFEVSSEHDLGARCRVWTLFAPPATA